MGYKVCLKSIETEAVFTKTGMSHYITLGSTLTRSSSTCWVPIYGSNRTVQSLTKDYLYYQIEFLVLNINA